MFNEKQIKYYRLKQKLEKLRNLQVDTQLLHMQDVTDEILPTLKKKSKEIRTEMLDLKIALSLEGIEVN